MNPLLSLLILLFLTCCKPSPEQTTRLKHDSLPVLKPAINTAIADTTKISIDRLKDDYIRHIFEDAAGNFWFGTNSYGVGRYDGKKLEWFSVPEGLGGFQITGIKQDKKGNMWFSTNAGISMFDGKSFTNYTTRQGLGTNCAWSLYIDRKDVVWAGTTKGLYHFNGSTFEQFDFPPGDVKAPQSHFTPKLVWCMAEDKEGNLWMGTDGDGVCIYNTSTKKFRHLYICGNNITEILFDAKGNVWFGSFFGGVSMYDGKTYTSYASPAIGDNEALNVFEDKNGNIWFSSEGFGVYRYDGKELVNFGKSAGLGVAAVQAIFEDSKGRLWFGGGGGAYRLEGARFVQVTTNGPW